jgi:mRNA-degrading endonuclease RelE of RelBE toxin-antitoxin system
LGHSIEWFLSAPRPAIVSRRSGRDEPRRLGVDALLKELADGVELLIDLGLLNALVLAPETIEHLKALDAGDRARVFDAIRTQLLHQPTVVTRHRKPLEANPLATWELRVGRLRVFYDVHEGRTPIVEVLAVGVKDRAELRIGGKVVKL